MFFLFFSQGSNSCSTGCSCPSFGGKEALELEQRLYHGHSVWDCNWINGENLKLLKTFGPNDQQCLKLPTCEMSRILTPSFNADFGYMGERCEKFMKLSVNFTQNSRSFVVRFCRSFVHITVTRSVSGSQDS